MPEFHVFTSDHIPANAYAFEEVIEDGQTLGMRINCDVPYELTPVDAFGSTKGVPITEKTRYVAFLGKTGEFYRDHIVQGIVGSPELFRHSVRQVHGVDGRIIWKPKDAWDSVNIIPPEMVGLKPFPWWKPLLTWDD